jgi:hypothetical protein
MYVYAWQISHCDLRKLTLALHAATGRTESWPLMAAPANYTSYYRDKNGWEPLAYLPIISFKGGGGDKCSKSALALLRVQIFHACMREVFYRWRNSEDEMRYVACLEYSSI